jgi:hypothetical protein
MHFLILFTPLSFTASPLLLVRTILGEKWKDLGSVLRIESLLNSRECLFLHRFMCKNILKRHFSMRHMLFVTMKMWFHEFFSPIIPRNALLDAALNLLLLLISAMSGDV